MSIIEALFLFRVFLDYFLPGLGNLFPNYSDKVVGELYPSGSGSLVRLT